MDINKFEIQSTVPKLDAMNQVKGTSPVPGGPEPIEAMSPARTSLKESLVRDIAGASKALEGTESRLGLATPAAVPTFQEKGIKIGNQVVAQNELGRLMDVQNKTIGRYIQQAGFTTQMEASTAQQLLNERLNKLRMDLIKKGIEFDKKLALQKASIQERRAAAKSFGQLAGTVAGGIIGGIYGGGPMGAMTGASVGGTTGGQIGGAFGS